ncbi:MAG: asparagine synthetase B family protein, partial [Anaerolineales bacterium]
PLHVFSGGFQEATHYDETRYARLVADHIGAHYHQVFPTVDDFIDLLPHLVYIMDEPAAGPGLFPQYMVSKLAREHVKVVLGGQGGDEIFGGYTRYLVAYLEEVLHGSIEGTQADAEYVATFETLLPNLGQLRGYRPMLQYFWREGLFEAQDARYFRLINRSESIQGYVQQEVLHGRAGYSPYEAYRAVFNADPQCASYINRMIRFDTLTLLPALLHVEDRTSMAVSLESRVPLLDHRIIELMASVPPTIKYKGGQSKYLFRRAIQHIVPEAIFKRSDKMGFPVPLNEWYAQPQLRSFITDTMLSTAARQRGIFQPEALETVLSQAPQYDRGLWGALSLELWFQTFIDA